MSLLQQKEKEKPKYKIGCHIFRRDYRLIDNTALNEALMCCEIVIPIFIFTYKQIRDNPYKSNNCVQFLCESLIDLNNALLEKGSRLFIFYGDEMKILKTIIKKEKIEALFFNIDATAYSKIRDGTITELCNEMNITCNTFEDITLLPFGTVMTGDNKMYSKYTPYYRAHLKHQVNKPNTLNTKAHFIPKLHHITSEIETSALSKGIFHDEIHNEKLIARGGRTAALKILQNISKLKDFKDYNERRNDLMYSTTHLSAYNKFGCVSIREVYYTIKDNLGLESQLIQQLIWRDFFYNISWFHPEIYKTSLNPKWRNIEWDTNLTKFNAWCEGKTGFPIVDAAMTEINTVGFMHNRGRLIVSNFLVRMLGIDWRRGEHYFATKLFDYDPAQNNMGWQVSGGAVSGTEGRYFTQTILNPVIQAKKFDTSGDYIKKWLPTLKDVLVLHLHDWEKYNNLYPDLDYPKPIISYIEAKEKSIKQYEKALKK
jgi:deoxyribodipyrimidine photo-lyase